MADFTDPRDGITYKTVELRDGNTWLAQNLAFRVSGALQSSQTSPILGYLYNWDMLNLAIPNGWRLPTIPEWNKLSRLYGGNLKQALSIIPAGYSQDGTTVAHGLHDDDACYWGKETRLWVRLLMDNDEAAKDGARFALINGHGFEIVRDFKSHFYSVRCVRK